MFRGRFTSWYSYILNQTQVPRSFLSHPYSNSTNAQEEYFKSLIRAFLPPVSQPAQKESPIPTQPTTSDLQQTKQKRLRLRRRTMIVRTSDMQPIARSNLPISNQPVASLSAPPSVPIELPKNDSPLGVYEHPCESPIPISSILHEDQTVTESVHLARSWFRQLDLNALNPPVPTSGNLAPYVPRSYTLQQLVLLGVDLSKVESVPGAANMLIKMDFHKTIEPVLWALSDLGFNLKQIAHLLTRFPKLLKVPKAELEGRFNYFTQHGFKSTETVELIAAQPFVLECTSVEIDRQLGQIQALFGLSASDVRLLVNSVPLILLHPIGKIKDVYVVLTKMCGFANDICRTMVCAEPKLLVTERHRLVTNFVFMHIRLDLSLDLIQLWPTALSAPPHLLPQRVTFLVQRGLFQPDPTKPLYTPLSAMVDATDTDFCERFARATEDEYDLFLKTI